MGASWGDDGNVIAALNDGSGLWRIPSVGGIPTPLTVLSQERGEKAHGWPQVLPGSRAVLFTSSLGSFADGEIDVFLIGSGERKTLHRGGFFGRYLSSGHLVYVHENTLYAAPFDLNRLAITGAPQPVLDDVSSVLSIGSANFDFSQNGTFVYLSSKGDPPWSIFWLDGEGKIEPLSLAPRFYYSPRLSPDGKRLAFAMSDDQGQPDIWVKDLARDNTSRLTSIGAIWPVWTPDGKNIFFSSDRSALPGIYSIRADGSGEPKRLTDKTNRAAASFSPDGKRLAYFQLTANGHFGIWTAPIEGDADNPRLGKGEPFLRTQYNEYDPVFSPDGRWLAYSSDETGTLEIYVRPFPGPGSKWQISTGYGRFRYGRARGASFSSWAPTLSASWWLTTR
jgi:serine/threonine-protein kinase